MDGRKRKLEIEVDEDVYFVLMKDHKYIEEDLKKQLAEDIDFIYNYTRFNKEQNAKNHLKLITNEEPSDV